MGRGPRGGRADPSSAVVDQRRSVAVADQWNRTYSKSTCFSFTPCCGGAM